MNKKTKKRLIIGGSVIAILGVVGVIYFKYGRKSNVDELLPEEGTENDSTDSGLSTTVGFSVSNSTGLKYPQGKNGVFAFQRYAKDVKKHKNTKGSLIAVDGIFGKESKLAWNIYAKAFINKLGLSSNQWNNIGYKG